MIEGKIQGVEIPPVAKSCGSNSNELAYAERALSTDSDFRYLDPLQR